MEQCHCRTRNARARAPRGRDCAALQCRVLHSPLQPPVRPPPRRPHVVQTQQGCRLPALQRGANALRRAGTDAVCAVDGARAEASHRRSAQRRVRQDAHARLRSSSRSLRSLRCHSHYPARWPWRSAWRHAASARLPRREAYSAAWPPLRRAQSGARALVCALPGLRCCRRVGRSVWPDVVRAAVTTGWTARTVGASAWCQRMGSGAPMVCAR